MSIKPVHLFSLLQTRAWRLPWSTITVKHGYVEKPDKKKYLRRQVARLIAITTLKTVFSIQEIASTLNFLQDQASSDLLYNSFVAYLNEQKEPIAPIIRSACQTVQLYLETLTYIQPVKTEEETDELTPWN